MPSRAGAAWPFSTTDAATNAEPVLHDPSLNLLTAPLSTDIDDTIDTTALTTSDGTALVPGDDLGAAGTDASTTDSSQDVVTSPTSGAISQYTVKAGDSLSEIAQSFGISVNTILWANDIKDPSTIKEGTVLVILPVSGVQHTVRPGETLSSIAAKFGADAGDIAQFNGLSSDQALQAGSTIIIPGGELSSGDSAPASDASDSTPKSTHKDSTSSRSTSSRTSNSEESGSSNGKMNYSTDTSNPYRGGGGSALHNFFVNPLPGAILTQGLHGLNAVDLAAPSGTPILAAAAGTVITSRMGGWNGGYGNYVILDNGSGVQTLYAHMTETKASVGDQVSAGQVIGYVGMTGDATGFHLHFEVRGAQNPFSFCSDDASDDTCMAN